MVAGYDTRPKPEDPDELEDWDEASRRHRMLDGRWKCDANDRLGEFFAPEVRKFLPEAVVAFCPLRSFVQDTSTLYNGAVTAHMGGATVTDERLGLDLLWAQQQQTLEFVRGLNDCYVRRSWDADQGCVTYTVVPPSCAIGSPDPRDPSQPNRVRYLVERSDIVLPRDSGKKTRWVWQDYDFRDPENPTFRVVTAGRDFDGGGIDVTDQVLAQDGAKETRPGNWQWWDRQGRPIWIWTAYHVQVGPHLRRPFLAHEVVDGTLIAAALWTYWLGGFRDAAWNLRWLLNCEIPSLTTSGQPQPWIPANPMAILNLKSKPGETASAGAFPTPFDVEGSARAIGQFMASLGLFMGLSSADTSVTGSGLSRVSGFAIEVSRDGKRKIEERMVLPMTLGDRHNLAGAARLANAYANGPLLSERPKDWSVLYASTPKSSEEFQAEMDATERQVEAGMLDMRDAVRRLRPEMTREQAEQYALEAARFRRRLEADPAATADPEERIRTRSAVEQLAARPDVPDTIRSALGQLAASLGGEAGPAVEVEGAVAAGAPAQDTALNGAQVDSLLRLVEAVATRRVPRESAVAIIQRAYNVAAEDAETMLGDVGRGFFIETPTEADPAPPAV
jgi:hypothetical protein